MLDTGGPANSVWWSNSEQPLSEFIQVSPRSSLHDSTEHVAADRSSAQMRSVSGSRKKYGSVETWCVGATGPAVGSSTRHDAPSSSERATPVRKRTPLAAGVSRSMTAAG